MKERPTDAELKEQYKLALDEWDASEDAALWESSVGDGLDDEPQWNALLPHPNDDSGGASRRH